MTADRHVPRYPDTHPLALAVEFAGEPPWCDEQPTAPQQRLSNADPQRHTAAKLARLAHAWVDNAMGLGRSCLRLAEMQGLLDALRTGHHQHLERREREEALRGLKNDLRGTGVCEVASKAEKSSGGPPSASGAHVGAEWDPQP